MMKRRKLRNAEFSTGAGRDRKHLTGREVDQLLGEAKGDRIETRDRCLLLLMYRHGLRVSETCGLKLDQVDANSRVLHFIRLKRGLSTDQPLRADELRAIAPWFEGACPHEGVGQGEDVLPGNDAGRRTAPA